MSGEKKEHSAEENKTIKDKIIQNATVESEHDTETNTLIEPLKKTLSLKNGDDGDNYNSNNNNDQQEVGVGPIIIDITPKIRTISCCKCLELYSNKITSEQEIETYLSCCYVKTTSRNYDGFDYNGPNKWYYYFYDPGLGFSGNLYVYLILLLPSIVTVISNFDFSSKNLIVSILSAIEVILLGILAKRKEFRLMFKDDLSSQKEMQKLYQKSEV
jgi:hypothetical protein